METWELVLKFREWKNDPGLFFEDITGFKPSDFQDRFLLDMADYNEKRSVIISAGRGTGKTFTLALLCLWYIYVLPKFLSRPIKAVVLGGSFEQSKNLYNYVKAWCSQNEFISKELAKEPTIFETLLSDGSSIKALTASEKSVRGPRSDILIIDEAVEAGEELIGAAMQINIASQIARTIVSSTPHEFNSLFVSIISKPVEYGFREPYYWSGEDAPWISKQVLEMKRKLMNEGTYMIEIEGKPYAFTGKVFSLTDLKNCLIKKTQNIDNTIKIMGVDWGHYPAPTVGIIIQKLGDRCQVLFADAYLKEKFEEVMDSLETIARNYKVQAINVDSIPPGEGERLRNRALPVYMIRFKSEKPLMISNLQSLVENNRIQIPEDNYNLISQMRSYRFDSKKDDDYVDALMLACRTSSIGAREIDMKDFIYVGRKRNAIFPLQRETEEKIPVKEGMCTECGKYPFFKDNLCMNCFEKFLEKINK